MRGIPFVIQLNKNVLAKSKGIEGRFYLCPNMGREINDSDFDQVIQDEVLKANGKQFPVSIMMPPTITGSFTETKGEWRDYHFIMFFLKTTYYTGTNQASIPNVNTRTSTHSVPEDWHDMDRCAVSYIQVLSKLSRSKRTINDSFRLDQTFEKIIRPVSFLGAHRLSGVRLDYRASVFTECALEDYNESDIAGIEIPVADSHPEHIM